MNDLNGVFNILKPPGMTSSDVVYALRRMLGQKRIGHAGTLDPQASGVLPICVGRATKLFDYLLHENKSYRCEVCFGISTDTADSEGKVIKRMPCDISEEDFLFAAKGLVGSYEQRIPMYSAKKVDGKRLYELARKGESVQLTKPVSVQNIHLVEQTGKNKFLFDVDCSRGTFIRTICEDLGEALDVPAYMSFLLRTRSGGFVIDESISMEELESAQGNYAQLITKPDDALSFMHTVYRPKSDFGKLLNGGVCKVGDEQNFDHCRVYCNDQFIGVGSIMDSALKIKTLFYLAGQV